MSSPPSPGSTSARRSDALPTNSRDANSSQVQAHPIDLAQKPMPVTITGISKLTADQQRSIFMVKPGSVPGSMITQQIQPLPSVTTSVVQPSGITIARMPAIVRPGNSSVQTPTRPTSPSLTHGFAPVQTPGVLHVPKGAAAVASISLPRAAIVRPATSVTATGAIGLSTIRVPRPAAPSIPNVRPSSSPVSPAWVSVTPTPSSSVSAVSAKPMPSKIVSQSGSGISKPASSATALPHAVPTVMPTATQLRLATPVSTPVRSSALPLSVPQATVGMNASLRPMPAHEVKPTAQLHLAGLKSTISMTNSSLEKTYSKGTAVSSMSVSVAPVTSVTIRPAHQSTRPTTVSSPRPGAPPYSGAYLSTQKVTAPPTTGLQQASRPTASPLILTAPTSNIKTIVQTGKPLNMSSALPATIRGPSQLSVSHSSIPKIMTSAGTVIPVSARGGPMVVTTSSFAKVLPATSKGTASAIDLASSASTTGSGITLNLSTQEGPISGLYLQATRATTASGNSSHGASNVFTLQPTTTVLYDDTGTYTQTLTLQPTGSESRDPSHQSSGSQDKSHMGIQDAHDNDIAPTPTTTSAPSTLAIPTTPSKLGASPRPSILRKRDHDGTPLKAQKNLSAALNVGGLLHTPLASNSSTSITAAQITSTTTATLTASMPSPPSNSSSSGSTTLSASPSPVSGLLTAGPDGEESTQSSSHFPSAANSSNALASVAGNGAGLSSALPNLVAMAAASLTPAMEMSPRKKPRKQMLGLVMQEVRYSDEEMQTVVSGSQDREAAKNDSKRETKLTESAADDNKSPDPDNEENSKVVIKRPQLSLLGKGGSSPGWTNTGWKSRHSHFQRYTDVKLKDDRRPTVHDLANQKQVMQKIVGWKVHHLAAQIEDMASLEAQVYERFQALMGVVEKTAATGKAVAVDRVDELIKGNLQRSEVIRDQLLESRAQILKVLEHQPRIEEIIHHYANKRAPKKRERT